MDMTLSQIFRAVARVKKIKNEDKWVEDRLVHCEVDTDYGSYLHLKSHKSLPFGVRDGKFKCQQFVLYVEWENPDLEPNQEFEIFTFDTLEDKKFGELLKAAYNYYYDSIKVFQLFFESGVVNLKVKTSYGYATLGDYTDWDDYEGFEIDKYTVRYEGSNIIKYYHSKVLFELYLSSIKDFFTEKTEEGMKCPDLICSYGSEQLEYRVTEEGQLVCLNEI